ncbi:hypothetical protein AB0F88_42920 [Streptosporangium sp. NPDC023963]|uniref:hypothetical protein n=1 Tax=Streptosporangium sp. NPDC023963 TaxID=3155608 RepID=UPI003413A3DB
MLGSGAAWVLEHFDGQPGLVKMLVEMKFIAVAPTNALTREKARLPQVGHDGLNPAFGDAGCVGFFGRRLSLTSGGGWGPIP